jgi:hypothetical protein
MELIMGEQDRLITMTIGDSIPGRDDPGISLIEEAKAFFRSVSTNSKYSGLRLVDIRIQDTQD